MTNLIVEQIGNEPIIRAKATGYVDVELLLEVYRRSDALRKNMPKHIYRITDVLEMETSFTDMAQMMREAAKRQGSSSTDPTVTVVFVGTSHWVKLFTDAMRQGAFGGKVIPVFDNYDDALAYVRAEIVAKSLED